VTCCDWRCYASAAKPADSVQHTLLLLLLAWKICHTPLLLQQQLGCHSFKQSHELLMCSCITHKQQRQACPQSGSLGQWAEAWLGGVG
jgi:hypothetical protein